MGSVPASGAQRGRVVGRYVLYDEIAAGGMATVHLGRLLGAAGFSRTVAIKRLHPQFAKDPEFVSMFTDEARLAGRIRHPNVVGTIDVVSLDQELLLVMDYVQGESLSKVLRSCRVARIPVPPAIVSSIIAGVLQGLHAAHEAKTERGEPLAIVHRDVSPQNMIVGADGIARVVDFGVAKAAWRAQTSREGEIKGKVAYMSPEQLLGQPVDRRTDIFAASTVLWEALTGARLFQADGPGEGMHRLLYAEIAEPSSHVPSLSKELDAVVMRGLSRDPSLRFATAREMAAALEKALPPATVGQVSEWLESVVHDTLAERSRRVEEIESSSLIVVRTSSRPPSAHDASEAPPRAKAPTLATIAMDRPDERPLRGRKVAATAAAALLLCVIGLLAWRLTARKAAENTVTTVPAPSTTLDPAPSASTASSPSSPASSATAAPAASAQPPYVSPSATNRVKVVGGAPASGGSPRKTRSCNPPYVIDPNGFHVPKPECL